MIMSVIIHISFFFKTTDAWVTVLLETLKKDLKNTKTNIVQYLKNKFISDFKCTTELSRKLIDVFLHASSIHQDL